MKINVRKPPRKYRSGLDRQIVISDCGSVELEPNEQLTFVTPSGKEHDFAAKEWGFYSTPSINSRLKNQGFDVALVKNTLGKIFVMTVDSEKRKEFEAYLAEEEQEVVEWLSER